MRVFNYIKALLKRHWVSFIFASVIPAIVGLFAVAAITVVEDIHYFEFLKDEYYEDVICVGPKWNSNDQEGFSYGARGFQYYMGTKTEEYAKSLPVVGKSGSAHIAIDDDYRHQRVDIINYEYWQIFPNRLYKGSGFTGKGNEIILDICHIRKYELGKEYEFCGDIESAENKESFKIKALVVGFSRVTDYSDFGSINAVMCLSDEEAQRIGVYGYDWSYVKIPKDDLRKLFWGSDDETNPLWTIGLNKQNSTMGESDINKFALAVFVAIALSILTVISDLCLNGSMLKRTERIAVRIGLTNKDIAIAYILKVLLQLLLSTIIMLGVVLYFNHKTGALLILESLWGGIVAVLFLGLVSWAIDSIRLYRSWRVKK